MGWACNHPTQAKTRLEWATHFLPVQAMGRRLYHQNSRMCLRRKPTSVYTHSMRRIAAAILLCVFGALLPSATVVALAAPQQLLPICCRAHGAHACTMGSSASVFPDTGPTLRQPACPFGEVLRAITTVTISTGFSHSVTLGLVAIGMSWMCLAGIAAGHRRRPFAPRGPPLSFSV
jgi:hypothetical protein